MKKVELLAPAGSFEKAKIAFLYGADAVYMGTANLSLRTRVDVGNEELLKTVEYAHSLNKKVYAAINIYAWDETYDEIKKQAIELEKINVDGVIVSDGGVIDAIKEVTPNIPIHISTQANTVSYHTCNFWHKNGAERIVLGRELNKEQIKQIMENKPENLEIEIYVHGAICFGYSGRCFLSEYLSRRNANLGDCAQSCRWSYNMYVEETNNPGNLMPVETDDKGTYIFSSKDLCLIKQIPEIIDMGVDSLKIEGRLKTEYYLASVINTYRTAIDNYIKNPTEYNYERYLKELMKTKTRGLTEFFFEDRNNKDFQDYEGHQYNAEYEFGGKIIKQEDDKKTLIEIRNKLSIGDELEVLIPGVLEPYKFEIRQLWNDETNEEINTVNPGRAEQKVILEIPIKVQKDWIIRRKK